MTSLEGAASPAAGGLGTPQPAVASQPDQAAWFWRVIRAAWHVVGAAPGMFFGASLLLLLADLIGLYTVQLVSVLTAALSAKGSAPAVPPGVFGNWLWTPQEPRTLAWLFLVLVVLIVALRLLQRAVSARAEVGSLARLRLELHNRLLTFGRDYHRKNNAENLAMMVSGGAQTANQMFHQLLASPITQLIPLATAIAFIYSKADVMEEQHGLVLAGLFLMLILLPVVGLFFARRVDRAIGKAGALSVKLTTELANSLSRPEEVELMDALSQREQSYKARLLDQAKAQTAATARQGYARQIEDAVQSVMQALFLVYGAYASIRDPSTAGAIVGLYLFVPNAINPLRAVVDLAASIAGAHATLGSVLTVLESKPAIVPEGAGIALTPNDRSVSLRKVSLTHGGGVPLLADVSVEFAAGKITAIVARAGQGKSTLLNLIAGLWPPDSGTVLIGDKNVREIATRSLHTQVVKVSQEPLLITGPVRDNFKLVKADATDAEIEEVCRRTGLWAMLVKHMPREHPGDSPLDLTIERDPKPGTGLSGGERRLLAVSRALLLHPAVLLLDEPTSGLDADARKAMCGMMSNVFAGTTVILVDHHMEFVKDLADQVICLDGGRITSAGPPQLLLGSDSLFAELRRDELNPKQESAGQTRTTQEWSDLIKTADQAGEFLMAFDLANKALTEFPNDTKLQYLAVLARARSGATQLAKKLYDEYHLSRELTDDPKLRDDIGALSGRILKDEARQASGETRVALLRQSAEAYADVFRRSPKYYQGINAATLFTLAGDDVRAAPIIQATAEDCDKEHPTAPDDVYYLEATRAELALLRGDTANAEAALARAIPRGYGNWAAMATTRRQLLEICQHRGLPTETLKRLEMPRIVQYLGHMIAPPGKEGRFPADQEAAIAAKIADYLAENDIRVGYGSLACGADILFAEALLARKAELNIVLPFNLEEFKQVSVARGGDGWLKRFDECLAGARSVLFGTEDMYMGDDSLFPYATRLAMGVAILRAQHLGADVNQVAVWDGLPSVGEAGTAIDIDYWQKRQRRTDVIPVSPSPAFRAAPQIAVDAKANPTRKTHAMLFGDFHGYSTLRERDVPVFQRTYMAGIAEVLRRFGDAVQYRNTWGDAIYVVMGGVVEAAECALAIQKRMQELDPGPLPMRPELRLSGHFGPTFEGYDFVCQGPTYFGAQVTRAARLEPVTPTNQVFVTEPFAAAAVLENATKFSCEYVGELPAAKHYGSMRMYMLRSVTG